MLLNFHGQLVAWHRRREEDGLYYLVEMTGAPTELRLMLPARTCLVANTAAEQLEAALELETYRYVQRRGHHAMQFKHYQRALALGVQLPEATPTFKVGLIGGGDLPEPIEVTLPDELPLQRCYRMSETLAEREDFAETNVHLLAALGTFPKPFVPVAIQSGFKGYSWAQLPTIDRIELNAGNVLHKDYVGSGQLVCVDRLVLTAHTSDGQVFHSSVCMAIRVKPTEEPPIWGAEEVLITPAANDRLLAAQIWHHLGGWSEDGDTYDTQEYQFEQELNRFWAELMGPDEHLRRELLEALDGLKEKWHSVTIAHNGRVTICRANGKSRTIKPARLPQ